jgi:predicted nucleic acid-binding protein
VPDLLVDTDVFVDHLRGARRIEPGRERILYSVVTRCELFAGRETEEETIQVLLAPFEEVPLDRPIAERAGRLRRAGGLRTPDALIAATALEHQLVLVTRNTRDFRPARGLTLRPAI